MGCSMVIWWLSAATGASGARRTAMSLDWFGYKIIVLLSDSRMPIGSMDFVYCIWSCKAALAFRAFSAFTFPKDTGGSPLRVAATRSLRHPTRRTSRSAFIDCTTTSSKKLLASCCRILIDFCSSLMIDYSQPNELVTRIPSSRSN